MQQGSTTMSIQAKGESHLQSTFAGCLAGLMVGFHPKSLQLRSTLQSRGEQLDQDSTTFGIREIKFDADRGFLLNGEHVKMNGVCIHGDCGSVGTAVPERMWERRLELLQADGLQFHSAEPQSSRARASRSTRQDGLPGHGTRPSTNGNSQSCRRPSTAITNILTSGRRAICRR